jgi:2-polyprenyl-3-methyl-5-hydroxy-6-metoxy-1,4-benzoquinol methylase
MGNGTQKYDPPGKGWFAIKGRQKGDRQLAEQMKGLEKLLPMARGATVLDLGCAEGLIALNLIDAGAGLADGLESVESRVATGREIAGDRPMRFHVADLERFHTDPPQGLLPEYDLVLLLSIAHKMPEPGRFIAAAAARCRKALAVRLPAPVIKDVRSRYVPCDVPRLLLELGFGALWFAEGPRGEWVGVFGRQGRSE